VVSFTSRPLYPQGKSPWYPLDRRLGGRGGEEKNSRLILIIIIIIIIIIIFPKLSFLSYLLPECAL
jgi:hypothetical protein